MDIVDVGALTGLIGAILVLGVTGVALGGAYAMGRIRGHRDALRQSPTTNGDDGELHRLQQTIEAMSVELERIGESQRFIAKLQAERGSQESSRASFPRST